MKRISNDNVAGSDEGIHTCIVWLEKTREGKVEWKSKSGGGGEGRGGGMTNTPVIRVITCDPSWAWAIVS